MFDLCLLVEILFHQTIHDLLTFGGIFAVIAHIHTSVRLAQLDNFCDNFIQKITVMGYNQYCTAIIGQVGFQPCNGIDIQMIGRLV